MKVSLIATVKNEEATIETLLASIAAQTRPPDEVVIVDGGSEDGTLALLDKWKERLPLRVLQTPGVNISQGRNRAIEVAEGPIIAATDAGVDLKPDWLPRLLAPFDEWERDGCSGKPPVACGFFRAAPKGLFETALAAVTLPLPEEIDPSRFLPSSRSVAFGKDAWSAVGGYPEWLDYSEDLVFDLRLREAGYPFVWLPAALVYFRPRRNLRAFVRQYYQYARGDGKADLWRRRHALRYIAYLAGLGVLGFSSRAPVALAVLLAAGTLYCAKPYARLIRLEGGLPLAQRLLAAPLVPFLRAAGDVAKMAGYPAGVWWRQRKRSGRGWWEPV